MANTEGTELPTVPVRVMKLPLSVDGRPVPFCVDIDSDGKPLWQVTNAKRGEQALTEELCWCCGVKLGTFRAFILKPNNAMRRHCFTLPMHADCAEWMATTFPTLQEDLWALYVTKGYNVKRPREGAPFILLAKPEALTWWSHGQPAGFAQIIAHFDRLIPEQVEKCRACQRPNIPLKLLQTQYQFISKFFPLDPTPAE